MMKKLYFIFLIGIILFFFVGDVFAGGGVMWQENGVLVCDSTFGGGLHPMDITSDGYGGAIIVWQDGRTLIAIACQRIDSLGDIMWDEDGVIIDSFGEYPSVISDDAGGSIIAWMSYGYILNEKVYVQRVSSNGIPLWGYPGVPVALTDSLQQYPSIVSDGAGGCIIAWIDHRNGNADIYAQRVDSNGVRLWGSGGVEISSEPGIYAWFPSISCDEEKGAIITWSDERYGDYDCFAQRIDSIGNLQWGVNGIEVYVGDSAQSGPQIIKDLLISNDKRIISWSDGRNGGIDIYAQEIDLDGNIFWQINGVPICVVNGIQARISIISDFDRGAIFMWVDYRTGIQYDVYVQRVDSNGICLWDSNGVFVNTMADTSQEAVTLRPQICSDNRNGAIVTWKDYRSGNWDIYCQRVDSSGVLQWGAGGLPVCVTPEEQGSGPVICEDSKNGAIIAWGDKRLDTSVYAQRVGDVEGVEERWRGRGGRREGRFLSIHPNPFTTVTTITFTLPSAQEHKSTGAQGETIALKIYDVTGRLVKTFSLLSPPSSLISSVTWDGRDDRGDDTRKGVYFVKLTIEDKNFEESCSEKVIKFGR
jgi:hypothetical protein